MSKLINYIKRNSNSNDKNLEIVMREIGVKFKNNLYNYDKNFESTIKNNEYNYLKIKGKLFNEFIIAINFSKIPLIIHLTPERPFYNGNIYVEIVDFENFRLVLKDVVNVDPQVLEIF